MLDDLDTYSRGSEAQPSSTLVSIDRTTAVQTTFSRAQTEQLSRSGTDNSTRSVYGLEHLPSLKAIYELCLNAMAMMARRGRHALLQNSSARLKLWGTGIFELPVPLDSILMMRNKDSNAVRQAFLKAMARILVLQERDLRRLRDSITDQTGDEYRQLSIMQAEISSMLGTDELVECSLVSWANSLQTQKDLAAVLRQHPTKRPDDLHEIEAMLDYNSISKIIETLFHLLPAIRSERRTFSLLSQAQHAAKGSDTHSLSATIRAESTVEDSMHKIEDFIKKRDARAAKQGRQVTLYEPMFRKEKDRLETLRRAKDRPLETTRKTTDNSVIEEKKDELAKILSTFAREIESADDKPIAIQTSVPAGKKPIDVKQSSDAKELMSDATRLDDENLTALMNSLRGLTV